MEEGTIPDPQVTTLGGVDTVLKEATVADTDLASLTLGGGLDWLGYKYGFACDNLLSADLVIADGQVRMDISCSTMVCSR
jgi:hypothetical protein